MSTQGKNIFCHVSAVLVVLSTALATSIGLQAHADAEAPKWFFAQNPRAVALLAHGLNLRPSRMDVIAKLLTQNGLDVYRLRLQGHGDSLESFKSVSRSRWLKEVSAAVDTVRNRAADLKVPTFFVGYSVGALVYADLVSWDAQKSLGPQILFAPALIPRTRNKLILPFKIFGEGFCVKSLAPSDYRANDCTPMAAYVALFDSATFAAKTGFSNLNVRTLAFIDDKDELVSASRVQAAVESGLLSNWQIHKVGIEESTLKTKYHHLIVDEAAVGSRVWAQIKTRILDFLAQ